MKKSNLHHSYVFICILFLVVLVGLFYSRISHATTTNNLSSGTQLAYYTNNYPRPVYYQPKYHYRGSYRTPWTYIGHDCRKTCWVDRWTGKSLSCYKTC